MGNDISKLKLSNTVNEERLREYTNCKMNDLMEATEFWINSMGEMQLLNISEFEEVCSTN